VASLRQDLAEALGVLEVTRAELAAARERIAELEARLRQTPRNSSRPPSSEGLDKPPPRPRSLRKKTGRKPGGQDGHDGSALARAVLPDREVRHEPGRCGRCGAAWRASWSPQWSAVRSSTFVYLSAGQFLSRQRTAQALAELFGIPLSSGTVAGSTARAAGRLGEFPEHARGQIAASEVAGFDETGFRVQGRLH